MEIQYKQILTSKDSGILTITLNREDKLNALNIGLLQEIKVAVHNAQSDSEVSGIIITGSGNKAFAAGADISEFANFSKEEGTKMSRDGHSVMNTIENSSKPVIAAVNGFALGGGCELAMACHIRIASESAKFGQPEVNLGVPPGFGGTQRLIELIGKGRALELLMTTDVIDATTAERYGLVNKVVAQEELVESCTKMLNKIATKSPMAIGMVIRCANDFFINDKNGMETEIYSFGSAFETPDFNEGTDAFLNKRRASFSSN
jgi:enoyl-CoA hydratase